MAHVIELSGNGDERLARIMDLRQCSKREAFDYAITCGWLAAEKMEERRMAKSDNTNPDNKAPNTGSNKGNDNKATDTGKPYPPDRRKAE